MRFVSRLTAAAVLAACLLPHAGCSPPQVLGDDNCFKTVDALWTAVTAKSPKLLDSVSADLQKLHEGGRLADDGYQALDAIVAKARSGKWEPAAKELKSFIQGQRRPARR
jgi:hypothetical protein